MTQLSKSISKQKDVNRDKVHKTKHQILSKLTH